MTTAARLATASLIWFWIVTPVHAVETDQNWLTDASGCKFKLPSRSTGFTWNGKCVDGFVSGQGTLEMEGAVYQGEFERGALVAGEIRFADGSSYKGALKNNEPAGRGVMRLPDTTVIEGTFERRAVVGEADVTWDNGTRYHGEVINLATMHGKGKLTHANGTIYEGSFAHGQYHGKGTQNWPDGSYYIGDWAFGHEQGYGVQGSPTGFVYEGEWVLGSRKGKGKLRTGDGTRCVGEFVANELQGQARCDYPDGGWQQGEWKNGNLNGKCEKHYASKAWYSGECFRGEPSGRGHFENPATGTIYDGEYVMNKYHGHGRLTRPGYVYEGQFMDSLANGRGKEVLETGEQYEGDFARGLREGNGTVRVVGADGTVAQYKGAFKEGYMHGQGELTAGKAQFTGEFKQGVFMRGRIRTAEGRTIEADLEAETFFEVKADGSKVQIDPHQLAPEPEA
jgi:hypothetical protein